MAMTAIAKGKIPIAKTSSILISNCNAMNKIGISVAGMAIIPKSSLKYKPTEEN